MRHRVMSLNQFSSIDIHRHAHSLAWFRGASFDQVRAMNKYIAALLRAEHAKLTNFSAVVTWNMQQSVVSDLSAHFGIKGRLIENDGDLFRLVSWQNTLNNRLSFQKIVAEKFCRLGF